MQATIVESQAAVEALYRAQGDKIYRAVWAFSQDADLASVRDPKVLANLPEAERAAWSELWAEVDRLMRRP